MQRVDRAAGPDRRLAPAAQGLALVSFTCPAHTEEVVRQYQVWSRIEEFCEMLGVAAKERALQSALEGIRDAGGIRNLERSSEWLRKLRTGRNQAKAINKGKVQSLLEEIIAGIRASAPSLVQSPPQALLDGLADETATRQLIAAWVSYIRLQAESAPRLRVEPWDPTARLSKICELRRQEFGWTVGELAERAGVRAQSPADMAAMSGSDRERVLDALELPPLASDPDPAAPLPYRFDEPEHPVGELLWSHERSHYYRHQGSLERDAREVWYGTEVLAGSLMEPSLIREKVTIGRECNELQSVYEHRCRAIQARARRGQVRIRALFTREPTRKLLGSFDPEKRRRYLDHLEQLHETGRLKLRVIDGDIPAMDLRMLSMALTLGKDSERSGVATADQLITPARRRSLRVESAGASYYLTSFELFMDYWHASKTRAVSPRDLADLASSTAP